ncbi:MAG: hypothetical protein ACC653_05590 [Gammaproteobacteria bacterium]
MTRRFHILLVLIIQLIITSCSGYGLIYDDLRLETLELEQQCLKQPDSECLLATASAITATMSDDVAHAEALTVIAKTRFQTNDIQAALNTIRDIRLVVLQFNALFELSEIAKQQQLSNRELLTLANRITSEIEQSADKIAALILNAILHYDNQQPELAKQLIQQAIVLATTDPKKSIDRHFYNRVLPKIMQFETVSVIKALIALQASPALQLSAQAEYSILLKDQNAELARQLFEQVLATWHNMKDPQQHKQAQAAIVKMLVHFDELKQARNIRQQQPDVIAKVRASSVIIQHLTINASEQNITEAKQELVWLLQNVRQRPIPDIPVNALPRVKQQAAQADFDLASLRAQAIADVALGLAKMNKLKEAVHFAEQIQTIMGHIQGYTLTKLAIRYAQQDDINSALLTMESIHRPVNRAACLAEISAQVAKLGDLNRAIAIASRINRRSWRDIAYSEISILQARQNELGDAIKTLESIQRSYSAVYAMTGIARTLQASQNKR